MIGTAQRAMWEAGLWGGIMADARGRGPAKHEDRKLGDEWIGWKGESDPSDFEVDESASTFVLLASANLFFLIALLNAGWYLVRPRVEQFVPHAPLIVGWVAAGLGACLVLIVVLETVLVLTSRRPLLPYPFAERFLLSLFPITVWLGGKLRISKDRVGNSFIKVHNLVISAYGARLNADRILMLLPRCLQKETRRQIMSKIDGLRATVVTADGGEEARKAVREHKPTIILAVACERDLTSGIRDIAGKIPVVAIPNKRPQGPCKNTCVPIRQLEEALGLIEGRRNSIPVIDRAEEGSPLCVSHRDSTKPLP